MGRLDSQQRHHTLSLPVLYRFGALFFWPPVSRFRTKLAARN